MQQQLRIAHVNNIAGIASILTREQISQGHVAQVFANNPFELAWFGGTRVHTKRLSRHPKWKVRVDVRAFLGGRKQFLDMIKHFDIIHVHGPYPWILKLLRERENLQSSRIVLHWHGSDLRRRGYYEGPCFLSTPDLGRQAPEGLWVPNPVELEEIESMYKPRTDESGFVTVKKFSPTEPLFVAHMPYYKLNFRIPDVYSGPLKRLEQKGLCKVVEILKLPHQQALEVLSRCDIVVGKILPDIGWFGKLELEAMAMGKPVISYVADDLMERYDPPVSITSAETFEQDLEKLIQDDVQRQFLAGQGYTYIRQNHDSKKIADNISKEYLDYLGQNPIAPPA